MTIEDAAQPLVSVVVYTFNPVGRRARYLTEAIASIIHQTYENIEIIVSDNASEVDPLPLIESFEDPRLRYRRNPRNLGMAGNVAAAMSMARGAFHAILSDDDRWHPKFLERLVAALQDEPSAALAFCDQALLDSTGRVQVESSESRSRIQGRASLAPGLHKPFCRLGLVDGACYSTGAGVFRRGVIEWESIRSANVAFDLYMTYLACRGGAGAVYVPDRLFHQRTHEESFTVLSGSRDAAAKIAKAESYLFCYQAMLDDQRLADLHPVLKRYLAVAGTSLGIGRLRQGLADEARPPILDSLRSDISLRSVVALALTFLPRRLARRLAMVSRPYEL